MLPRSLPQPEQEYTCKAVVGKFYRPLKEPLTIRIDAEVLAWFKACYQTRINATLREAVAGQIAKRADKGRRTGIR